MLSFFPDPYPDELMYSIFARYHLRSGNVSLKSTLHDLFGSGTIISSLDFPSHLDLLCRRLPKGSVYYPDYFIDNHSLLPFYTPYMPEARVKKIREMMRGNQGKAIHMSIGIMAGGVCQKDCLYYCKACILKDIQTYGEPYWHRIHQTPGVFVCPIHHSPLLKYPIEQMNRHGFSACPLTYIDDNSDEQIIENHRSLSPNTKETLINIALEIQLLYANQMTELYEAQSIYLSQLKSLQFATPGGRVRQKLLHQKIERYYGNELLTLMESTIQGENSWLTFATRKTNRTIHPIRHLLLIRFLFDSIENFKVRNIGYHPFGKRPWPCLNRAAEHFMKRVIEDCNVTVCTDTRRPVGTFICECGFIFSRRGPDSTEQDQYRIGRIKEFGHIWLSVLNKKLKEADFSFRQIAEDLGVDTNTVIKYSKLIQTDRVSLTVYSPQTKVIKQNSNKPNPIPIKNKKPRINNPKRVNWELRDLEISILVEKECKNILSDTQNKPVRITVSQIGKRIGKLGLLQKNSSNLPVSIGILKGFCETIEQFQVRRVRWAALLLHSQNGRTQRWELERTAGLRSGYRTIVSEEIEVQIMQYRNEAPSKMLVRDGGDPNWIN